MLSANHVAIVGGGFSGTLLAINLLRHGAVRVTLIERRGDRFGRGLAYGAAQHDHILNVRAANMSALPDEPGHFADWLRTRAAGQDASFATRQTYGLYLRDLLEAAKAAAGARLRLVEAEAVDLRVSDGAATVRLATGAQVKADIAVLAPGNLPPHALPAFAGIAHPTYADDPWALGLADGLGPEDQVLLLGTGLTAVDCALSFDTAGFAGPIVAVSRRGLLPRAHAPAQAAPGLSERPNGSASALVRRVRARADAVGWRAAVDELRPFTQDMWRAADASDRARFLRHLRPYWDVHRHRIAPAVADRLAGMRAAGRLEIAAAKVMEARPDGARIAVALRSRGSDAVAWRHFARVVNCTGPLGDLGRTRDQLLRALASQSAIRPDSLAIGIDVDRQCRAIGAGGEARDRLRVVGPMTRGAHWEIVAVPDIRRQVWTLARDISNAHWVEAAGL
ncbi:FAD/NAD(P)-binding protein [Sphingobium sp. LMA1-1-1.1]|uniref:FAD/NAD(P)-binding protein n=1 Tax=Sphingobium sp. LMA1-1-1.1 TaxID=3135238 RepID=UPI003448DA71